MVGRKLLSDWKGAPPMRTRSAELGDFRWVPSCMPFLVLAAVVRGGADCQGSTSGRPRSGAALTVGTTTITTIASEGWNCPRWGPAPRQEGSSGLSNNPYIHTCSYMA